MPRGLSVSLEADLVILESKSQVSEVTSLTAGAKNGMERDGGGGAFSERTTRIGAPEHNHETQAGGKNLRPDGMLEPVSAEIVAQYTEERAQALKSKILEAQEKILRFKTWKMSQQQAASSKVKDGSGGGGGGSSDDIVVGT